MQKLALTLGALFFGVCAASPTAMAQTQLGDFTIGGNVGLMTDYVYRGVSQTDEGPAIQGGFDVSHISGFYAGIWGSNVDFNDGDEATVEVDYFAGYSGELSGVNYDLGALYYTYPGADDDLDYDYWEFAAAVGYDFDVFALSGTINYSPEFFGDTGDAFYYSAAVDVPLPYDLSLSSHIGHQTVDEGEDYTDWAVGLGYSLAGFDLALTYTDTDLDEPDECADGCSARIVASVSRSF